MKTHLRALLFGGVALLLMGAAASLTTLQVYTGNRVITGNIVVGTGTSITASGTGTIGATTIGLPDSDASHFLTVNTTSNLTANRTFTLIPGDAARTLTVTGNATISQDTTPTGGPTFANVTTTGNITAGGKLAATNAAASTATLTLNNSVTSTGIAFISAISGASAAERNWAILANDFAYGDFNILQSVAKGGDPVAAGSSALYFSANKNATLAGTITVSGAGTSSIAGPLTIGGGSTVAAVRTATATLDFPSTGAGAVADLTVTVTGAAVNDTVVVGPPNGSVTATATFTAWVSATNTVTVRFSPKATEDPASGTFRVTVTSF